LDDEREDLEGLEEEDEDDGCDQDELAAAAPIPADDRPIADDEYEDLLRLFPVYPEYPDLRLFFEPTIEPSKRPPPSAAPIISMGLRS
jgi:hypothetical protein